MQLVIDMPGLGHVNCYALEDGEGFALIDPGLPGPESWNNLTVRLAAAGIPLARIHTVIVTHSHPDHFGGASQLRAETGARIVSDRRFAVRWVRDDDGDDRDIEDRFEDIDIETIWNERKAPWGGTSPAPPPDRMRQMMEMDHSPVRMRPTERLDDADVISLARREWVALHTPGHTGDCLCLFDPEYGVMFSGDHVLPTITPHIGDTRGPADPLKEFFDSLDKVAAYGSRTNIVLPAHGDVFTDIAGRAEAIKRHHVERLGVLREASHALGRPASVMEMSTHLFSQRAQGPMADSETYAHLEHLRLLGEADVVEVDGILQYVVH